MDYKQWLWLNYYGIKENSDMRSEVSPFPPPNLMAKVSGLTDEIDFAAHGVHIYDVLNKVSPVDWNEFSTVIDFGCGCGRVARLIKNHEFDFYCVDIDKEHIDWVGDNLQYARAVHTTVETPLPFEDDTFDCIYSISVFTHITEEYHRFLLQELHRVTKPGGVIFITTHSERALELAQEEEKVFKMLDIREEDFNEAITGFKNNKYSFILQDRCHLTSEDYKYGITFIPHNYILENWNVLYKDITINSGAIHDFQDVIVLRPNK